MNISKPYKENILDIHLCLVSMSLCMGLNNTMKGGEVDMNEFEETIVNMAFEMEIKETFTNIREGKDVDTLMVIRSSKPIVFLIHNTEGIPVLCFEPEVIGDPLFHKLLDEARISCLFDGTETHMAINRRYMGKDGKVSWTVVSQ